MDERERGWTESTNAISLDEWNAGKTLSDVRKVTAATQHNLAVLDNNYRAQRQAILNSYAESMASILAIRPDDQSTQEIRRSAEFTETL